MDQLLAVLKDPGGYDSDTFELNPINRSIFNWHSNQSGKFIKA